MNTNKTAAALVELIAAADNLIALKVIKDEQGKTKYYVEEQPKAWIRLIDAIVNIKKPIPNNEYIKAILACNEVAMKYHNGSDPASEAAYNAAMEVRKLICGE